MLLVVFVLAWGDVADQGGDRQVHQRAAAVVSAAERDRAERPECAGAAQPDHARAAGHDGAGALCGGLRFQLAERVGHGLLPGHGRAAAFCSASSPSRFAGIYKATFSQLAKSMLTIASMLGLAYLMNYSGMTSTLGLALAATGRAFPFFSAILGWLGVFLTGSDTSSNALFGNLQVITANQIGLNPVLTASVNAAAGVMGKMISLASIAVAVRRDGPDLRGRRQALPLHLQAQHLPGLRRRRRGDAVRLRVSRAGAGAAAERVNVIA